MMIVISQDTRVLRNNGSRLHT